MRQSASLANEQCDLANALRHNISDQLREAANRIDQLEDEADGLLERLLAEMQTRIEKAEADAWADWTIREAEERIAHLQAELARASHEAEQVETEAHRSIERIKSEAEARLAAAQSEAKKRFDLMRRENEHKVARLEADLIEANNRAEHAERSLALIRREVHDKLIPSMKVIHDLMGGKPVDRAQTRTQDPGSV